VNVYFHSHSYSRVSAVYQEAFRFGTDRLENSVLKLNYEKGVSKYILSYLETESSVATEKHVGETLYLLQEFASAATLQTPWQGAMVSQYSLLPCFLRF
jgi:hypothetical protein